MKARGITITLYIPDDEKEIVRNLYKDKRSASKRARELMKKGLEYENFLKEIKKTGIRMNSSEQQKELQSILDHSSIGVELTEELSSQRRIIDVNPEEAKENIKNGLKNLKSWS